MYILFRQWRRKEKHSPWHDGAVASNVRIYVLPLHMGTHRFSGRLLRVLTEQKVPGVGVQSVQFHVVKEMVAEAVVARRRVRGANVCMVWFGLVWLNVLDFFEIGG